MQRQPTNESVPLICVGISHQTAPVEVRERLSGIDSASATTLIEACPGVRELVILSTCNRLELYAVAEDVEQAECALTGYVATAAGNALGDVRDHFYVQRGEDAGRHLLRVACGLESVILGESQVLGQISEANRRALEAGHAGPILQAEFKAAIRAGKRARRETIIGRNAVSVSSIAVNLAERMAGSLLDRSVLVIGLGEIGQLAAQALHHRGIHNVALINRSFDRAKSAARPPWSVYRWEELREAIAWADVIFTATGAVTPVLTRSMLEAADSRPRTIIDMAVPRDVAADAACVEGVTIFDIDDLQGIVDETYAVRQGAIPQVEAIIDVEMALLEDDLRELSLRGLLVDFRLRAEDIRREEVARTLRFLGDAEPEIVEHIEGMSRALVNKLLHAPTLRIRQQARSGDGAQIADALKTLFGLNGHSS